MTAYTLTAEQVSELVRLLISTQAYVDALGSVNALTAIPDSDIHEAIRVTAAGNVEQALGIVQEVIAAAN